MSYTIVEKVVEQMKELPQDMQQQVLEFTRSLALSSSRSVTGRELVRFAGSITEKDAAEIRAAIEQGCEQVDEDEW